jgi:hypothetical protein
MNEIIATALPEGLVLFQGGMRMLNELKVYFVRH